MTCIAAQGYRARNPAKNQRSSDMHARFLARSLTPDNPCAYRCRHHTRRSHAFLTHPMPRNMQGRSARSVARTQRYEQEPSAPAAALARDGSATARVRERRANSGTDVQHAIAANHMDAPYHAPAVRGPGPSWLPSAPSAKAAVWSHLSS